MTEIMQVLDASSKRACIDEKLIQKKSLELKDTRNFIKSLHDDISRTNRLLPAVELGLILMVSVVVVTDIIRDTAGAAGEKEAPVLKPMNWIYDKARKYRMDNSANRFKKHSAYVDKVLGVVKNALPDSAAGKQIKLTLDIFSGMAKNFGILVTAIEDSEVARKVTLKSLRDLSKILESLDSKIAKLDYWHSIGDANPVNPERMSVAPQRQRLP